MFKIKKIIHVGSLFLFCSSIIMPVTYAAPITFNTALPVAKGEFLIRQQLISVQSGNDPSTSARDRSETKSATALVYGVNHQLSLFGVLPYRDISLTLDSGTGLISRNNQGLGDISLFARYIFKQTNQPGSTRRWAVFGGLKLPTGEHDGSDNLGSLPPPLQTGSGAQDFFGGIVFTRQTLDWQWDAQVSYKMNPEANNFEVGDIFQIDGSWQKRLWPNELSSGTPAFLYGVLEFNLINQGENRVNGISDNNTGGSKLLLAPGIQYVTRRFILEASWQQPIIQNLNGNALELGRIFRAGFRMNF